VFRRFQLRRPPFASKSERRSHSAMAESEHSAYDELYKVVLVGDAGVGKTNMLAFFTGIKNGEGQVVDGIAATFHAMRKPTIGVEFGTRIVEHPSGVRIKAQIWDTAGQERYRAITSSHYRRAAGALLVYDVTSEKTFSNSQNLWLKELRDSADDDCGLLSCVMMVGNKIDLEQDSCDSGTFVSEEDHKRAASKLGLLEARTSAKTGQGVEQAFKDLILRIYDNDRKKQQQAKQHSRKENDHFKMHESGGGKKAEDKSCCK